MANSKGRIKRGMGKTQTRVSVPQVSTTEYLGIQIDEVIEEHEHPRFVTPALIRVQRGNGDGQR